MESPLIEIVDESGKVLEVIDHRECFERRLLRRAVHVLVFNLKGEVLLELRALDRRFFPGFWNCSSSGFVAVGEEPLAAARRETLEELGLGLVLRPAGTFRVDSGNDNSLNYLFFGFFEGLPCCFEARKVEWFSLKNLPEPLTPALQAAINNTLSSAGRTVARNR